MVIARIKAENVGSMLLIDDVKAGVVKQAILNPTTLCMALYFCLANIPGELRKLRALLQDKAEINRIVDSSLSARSRLLPSFYSSSNLPKHNNNRGSAPYSPSICLCRFRPSVGGVPQLEDPAPRLIQYAWNGQSIVNTI